MLMFILHQHYHQHAARFSDWVLAEFEHEWEAIAEAENRFMYQNPEYSSEELDDMKKALAWDDGDSVLLISKAEDIEPDYKNLKGFFAVENAINQLVTKRRLYFKEYES